MSEYDLERLEQIGLGHIAEQVRKALPGKAKAILREALSENEREEQEHLRRGGVSRQKYAEAEAYLKMALNDLEGHYR